MRYTKDGIVKETGLPSRETGESYVGVDKPEAAHALLGLLNIAFAGSSIVEPSKWEGNYQGIVDFMNDQYRMLTGRDTPLIDRDEDPQKIIERIREGKKIKEKGLYIELPDIEPYNIESLPKMVREALKAV